MKCKHCESDEGTMLKEFDPEKSYDYSELAEMTEVCVSCGINSFEKSDLNDLEEFYLSLNHF